MLSLFDMTCLVKQKNIVSSECRILNNMMSFKFEINMSYYRVFSQENGLFQFKVSLCIHNEDI